MFTSFCIEGEELAPGVLDVAFNKEIDIRLEEGDKIYFSDERKIYRILEVRYLISKERDEKPSMYVILQYIGKY